MSRLILLPLLLISSLTVHAADSTLDDVLQGFEEPPSSELDAVLGGFDNEAAATKTTVIEEEQQSWQLTGALTLGAAYNYQHEAPAPGDTDYRGLSRLRAKLNLEHDADLSAGWRTHITGYGYYNLAYQLNGRDDYTAEVLDEYESELELGEAWLQGKLNKQTDIKLGRQIVVWGKSDNIRVTDLINPLDNREPGMVDIEDLRLPLAMARLDYYVGDWGLSAMAIPEIRFNKNPPYGSDFYPLPTAMPDETIPGNTEYALAANGIFSGWDLSLYWADLYDDNAHRVISASGQQLQHSRLKMLGIAANVAINNWLLKGEAAQLTALAYSNLPNAKFNRTDILLGVEYSGFRDTSVSLEVANRHLHDYNATLLNEGVKEDEWQTALRYSGDFLHARLHLLAVVSAFGERLDEGGFGRYSAAYDLQDALTVTGGLVAYDSGEKLPFNTIGDNDRLFIDLKYSF